MHITSLTIAILLIPFIQKRSSFDIKKELKLTQKVKEKKNLREISKTSLHISKTKNLRKISIILHVFQENNKAFKMVSPSSVFSIRFPLVVFYLLSAKVPHLKSGVIPKKKILLFRLNHKIILLGEFCSYKTIKIFPQKIIKAGLLSMFFELYVSNGF